jgi:hypothetical protein
MPLRDPRLFVVGLAFSSAAAQIQRDLFPRDEFRSPD